MLPLRGPRHPSRHAAGFTSPDGRIDLLAVEAGFSVAARLKGATIVPADDPEAPDVVDDIVDEVIELVMRAGGRTVLLPDGDLAGYDRIAAVLRFCAAQRQILDLREDAACGGRHAGR